jgi:hypothetical protein
MITITRAQLASAERIIKERIKIPCLRKQALQELRAQVDLLQVLEEEDVKYIKWVTGDESAVRVLTNWIQVNGHDVRQLNKDLSEVLGLGNL